jgi:hypothetical protein
MFFNLFCTNIFISQLHTINEKKTATEGNLILAETTKEFFIYGRIEI